MEILTTPNNHPRTVQRLELDGSTYRLRLSWFDRLGAWYADLESSDATPIASGRRVSPGGVLFPRGVIGAPRGVFFVTGSEDPYEQTDLGVEVQIFYMSEAEYDAYLAELDAAASALYSVEVT